MNTWCICWFSRIFLLVILIFKGFTGRRLYKSFSVKGLILLFTKEIFNYPVIPRKHIKWTRYLHSYINYGC
jgi:hypothetical protein